jgi:cytochrome c biogenesis protein CcdA
MQDAFLHAIGLVIAVGLAFLGRFVIRHPERMVSFFAFGAGSGKGFFVGFSRDMGWVWCIGGILGTIMYLIMIPVDLLSSIR